MIEKYIEKLMKRVTRTAGKCSELVNIFIIARKIAPLSRSLT